MHMLTKCAATVFVLPLCAMSAPGLGSDLPPSHLAVTCVLGSFVVPANEKPLNFHTEDRLLVTVNNIPDDVFALIKRCYAQRKTIGQTGYLPFPLVVSTGPDRRNVMVLICVSDGAYKFAGVIAPKNDFTYAFSAKDKISRDNPLARQHC